MAAQELSFGGDKFTDKKWLRKTAKIALPLAVAGGALAVSPTPTAEASTGHSSATSSHAEIRDPNKAINVFVSSRIQRVDTGVFLNKGEVVDVQYLSGEWTVGGEQNYSGPGGLDWDRNNNVWRAGDEARRSCRVDDNVSYGTALGYIGNEEFPVGEGGSFEADRPGEFFIGINDNDWFNRDNQLHCLGDNRNLNGQPVIFRVTPH